MSIFGKRSKESKSTLDVVRETKSSLRRYRDQWAKGWKQEEESYHGKIWNNSTGFRPYENHVFQIVEGEVPILTDSFPGTTIKTEDPDFIPQAKSLNRAIEWVYKDQNFQLRLTMAIRNSLIAAPGYVYTFYDANAMDGDGQIRQEVLPWRSVYLHGGTTLIEDTKTGRVELSRSREWLKLHYPKFSKELDDTKSTFDSSEEQRQDRGRETQDTGTNFAQREAPGAYKDEDTLKLVLTYKEDYSLESIPEEVTQEELEEESRDLENGDSPDVMIWQDHPAHIEQHNTELIELYGQLGLSPEAGFEGAEQAVLAIQEESPDAGGDILFKIKLLESHNEQHNILLEENPRGERFKYPSGLRAIETVNEIILYDGKSKDDHNQIPIVPFYCYRNGTIYGYSEVRNILDSQRMQAVMQYKQYKGLQRVANPSLIIDIETGLEENDISNEDGGKYFIQQGTNIRHLDPGNISNQAVSFSNEKIQVMKDISGINEATQGAQVGVNSSGVAVSKLQQQAIGRVRLKDRQNQEYSIKRLGRLTGSLIIQYWTNDKIIDLEEVDGEFRQVIFNPLDMQELTYQVEIAAGSMAGIDKDSFNAVMLQFLGAGHISFEDFLEVAEIPRAKKLTELAKARNEVQAQLEQANEQLQQLQIENLKIKASVSPELLSPDEQKQLSEIQRQEELETLTEGVPGDQPLIS